MIEVDLPEVIACYFAADQRDGAAVARCFSEDAIVKDEGQTHCGPVAIEAWKAAASAKYSYTSKPFAVEQIGDRCIVTSRLTGNFPGGEVDLRFIFRVARGKITYLEITP